MTIVRAAKILRIKLPTAKVILMNYRKHGRILHKKNEDLIPASPQNREAHENPIEELQPSPNFASG